MQQFHPNFVPLEELEAAAEEAGQRNWAAIHIRAGRYYRMENPDLPTFVEQGVPGVEFTVTGFCAGEVIVTVGGCSGE